MALICATGQPLRTEEEMTSPYDGSWVRFEMLKLFISWS